MGAECAHRACNPPGPSELESGYVNCDHTS